jgi:hypothetical protein
MERDTFERNQEQYELECLLNSPQYQAETLSKFCGIELSDDQINMYKDFRNSKDPDVVLMSNVQLLHLIATNEQKDKIELRFWRGDSRFIN